MSSRRRPLTLVISAVVEAAEGLAGLVFGLFIGWETIVGKPLDLASAIGVAVLALLGGLGMLAVARGLLRVERWSRSPAVVTQLFALFLAWNMIQSEQPGYGVPLAAGAVIALIALLSGPTTTALFKEDSSGETGPP
ncbi:MAG: hypothetical protein QOE54_3035 [Streptosporangiaceae bacterium]|jgi:hypothetical protein|nr:hypothetical protein [Streptosporangiaceae bacterium]MDX6430669.1 hypothetical protein [Streptosporangiaceae bacterium]